MTRYTDNSHPFSLSFSPHLLNFLLSQQSNILLWDLGDQSSRWRLKFQEFGHAFQCIQLKQDIFSSKRGEASTFAYTWVPIGVGHIPTYIRHMPNIRNLSNKHHVDIDPDSDLHPYICYYHHAHHCFFIIILRSSKCRPKISCCHIQRWTRKCAMSNLRLFGKDTTPICWVVSSFSTSVLFCRSAGGWSRDNNC